VYSSGSSKSQEGNALQTADRHLARALTDVAPGGGLPLFFHYFKRYGAVTSDPTNSLRHDGLRYFSVILTAMPGH
jgi:hypothetical protein